MDQLTESAESNDGIHLLA